VLIVLRRDTINGSPTYFEVISDLRLSATRGFGVVDPSGKRDNSTADGAALNRIESDEEENDSQ
jgi:hypothetical protein